MKEAYIDYSDYFPWYHLKKRKLSGMITVNLTASEYAWINSVTKDHEQVQTFLKKKYAKGMDK